MKGGKMNLEEKFLELFGFGLVGICLGVIIGYIASPDFIELLFLIMWALIAILICLVKIKSIKDERRKK